MATSKFEKQALNQINENAQIFEGLSLALLKWFLKPKVKKALTKLKNDGDLTAQIADMNAHAKKLKHDLQNHPRRDQLDPRVQAMIDRL